MAKFAPGDAVQIGMRYPIGHCRTPWYARGHRGTVERYCGDFPNPEELAYGRHGQPAIALYRVRMKIADIWPNEASEDKLEVEIFEHWLDPVPGT